MAQVRFINPRAFGGVDYFPQPEPQTVPDDVIKAERWFYDACQADGAIIEVTPPVTMDGAPRKAKA